MKFIRWFAYLGLAFQVALACWVLILWHMRYGGNLGPNTVFLSDVSASDGLLLRVKAGAGAADPEQGYSPVEGGAIKPEFEGKSYHLRAGKPWVWHSNVFVLAGSILLSSIAFSLLLWRARAPGQRAEQAAAALLGPAPQSRQLLNDYDRCLAIGGAGDSNPCKRGWGSNHTNVVNFVMADGSVHPININIDINLFAALATIANGETLPAGF